jgi:N-acetylmuramoyl-L-alanine amidase
MQIKRHRLHAPDGSKLPFESSPNVGGGLTPRYLVMHYTAGSSANQSVRWLTNPRARASAHVVIGREGAVTQLVPFNKVAWHAGRSRWDGLVGLNRHSIGIELDNAGRLTRQGGAWRSWFGAVIPDDEVMEATHPHERAPAGWHIYTPEQIEAALELSRELVRKYELLDVVGHEDISPHRKTDPGPAFPMGSFRARLFGREHDAPAVFATTANLNIRTGPGTQHDKLPVSPLPRGTRVEILESRGRWRFVDTEGEIGGEADVQGWVHGGYLERAD